MAAEPAYELPKDLDTTDAVTARALEIERSCAATYAYLVASSPAPERRLAVNLLIQTAVRELAFRGTPETFPGSDEYADRCGLGQRPEGEAGVGTCAFSLDALVCSPSGCMRSLALTHILHCTKPAGSCPGQSELAQPR